MSGRVGAYLRQNVLGLVAIFLALSAGAYAVQTAQKNSVVSKSIKDHQVRHADLGVGAVSGDNLADGTVDLAKLGYDPATQSELDTTTTRAESWLASPGLINNDVNPVDWTKLKGVPAGFADGIDRLFGLSGNDSSGDTTPSVANLSVLSFQFPAPLTITDLEDEVPGQVLVLRHSVGGGTVTINDSLPFVLSANWVSTAGDTLTLASVGGEIWAEVARSVN